MQREPGRGHEDGDGYIGRNDTMRVHVTERDVTVPLKPVRQIHAMPRYAALGPSAFYALMHIKKRGYRGHVATVETVPWNLIRLIPA